MWKNVPFHGIHPSEVYMTGKQQLPRKMDHKVRHDVKKIWRKYPLKMTHDINDVRLHFVEVWSFHFPCACITSGRILPTLLTARPPDGEGTVEWKQGRDVVAVYDSHDSSTRRYYCSGCSHTDQYFLHSLKDTSQHSSNWIFFVSAQALRCKELKAFFSSLLSTKNVF